MTFKKIFLILFCLVSVGCNSGFQSSKELALALPNSNEVQDISAEVGADTDELRFHLLTDSSVENGFIVIELNQAPSEQWIDLPSGARAYAKKNGELIYRPSGAFERLNAGEILTETFVYRFVDPTGRTGTAIISILLFMDEGQINPQPTEPEVIDPEPVDPIPTPGNSDDPSDPVEPVEPVEPDPEPMDGHEQHDHGGDNSNPHPVGSDKHMEHMEAMNLVPVSQATHTAVANGSWFQASTWDNGTIPGTGARVYIPQGKMVLYDGKSDARVFTLLVNGHLKFSESKSSKLVVDTLFVNRTGFLQAGSPGIPIPSGVTTDIIIADNGDIDVTWDSSLLSRGIVCHGKALMHGQEKSVFIKLDHDPLKGATSVQLSQPPINWQVGDQLVIAGTNYRSNAYAPEDDVVRVQRIEGKTVFLDRPLQFSHLSPRSDLKTYVANYTRNITVRSESASPVHRRGHVMFMHSDNLDIRYVGFHELGRTDKSRLAMNSDKFSPITSSSNVKGRYSFHIHRAGFGNMRKPAIAVGNAVFGSPGWGFVHHDSNANFLNNAAYNTFGAAFVAETGNETGVWGNNISIYAKGKFWGTFKNGHTNAESDNFDLGKSGAGFYFQGRMVRSYGNVAASVNHGYVYFHRGSGMISPLTEHFDLPSVFGSRTDVRVDAPPILVFRDNEVFAGNIGLEVVKEGASQITDLRTIMKNFKGWNIETGVMLLYTGHYSLIDFDLIARTNHYRNNDEANDTKGIYLGDNATDISIIRPTIRNFRVGVDLEKKGTVSSITDYAVVDLDYAVNSQTKNDNPSYTNWQGISNYDVNRDKVISSNQLGSEPMKIAVNPMTFDGGTMEFGGSKTDPLGTIGLSHFNMLEISNGREILNREGYFSHSSGKKFFFADVIFSDRVTGLPTKVGVKVHLSDSVVSKLHRSPGYTEVRDNGVFNPQNSAPRLTEKSYSMRPNTTIKVDLLVNDSDADGDSLQIREFTQPEFGKAYLNDDGTVTIKPDTDFKGTDQFIYWVTDGHGNYSESTVTINVQ